MNKRPLHAVLVIAVIAVIAGAASPTGQAKGISYHSLNKIQKRLISGTLAMSLTGATSTSRSALRANAVQCGDGTSGSDESDEAPSCPPNSYTPAPGAGGGSTGGPNYAPSGNNGCAENRGNNVKVNQECETVSDPDLQGRGQAQNEESIAADPNNPNHVVASQNDYRRGDAGCYAAYSLDGGQNWSDSTAPMGFTRGLGSFARQYWEAGGDTSVGWDTRGNAYLSCQLFNRGEPVTQNPDQSSGFVVFRSTQNDGGSWNFPGRYVTTFFDPGGSGAALEDKQLMAIDDHVSSPFRDRIYVTWTLFASDGTAYIYEAHSSDYGETFSAPVVASQDSDLCSNTYGVPTPNGRCNENQFSDPFVGPDGALYVAYSSFNNGVTGDDNRNQILLVKSTDGGDTFSAPVKASDYYDLPDCATYQGGADAGRACVPEKGSSQRSVFRATNYASGAVNPKNPNEVVVTVGSYISPHSNESNGCVPTGFSPFGQDTYTGVKTPGACNNDILLSVSTDGGATFTGGSTDPRTEATVNQAAAQAKSDQFFQGAAFTNTGKLAVDYYDRQYGSDETTGWSDITLSGSKDVAAFANKRVTSASMPPPTQFSGTFYGDYIMLDTAGEDALPVWSDTRDPELFLCPETATGPGNPPALCTGVEPNGLQANDENTYMARMPVPTK